jgi:hypothetical protein
MSREPHLVRRDQHRHPAFGQFPDHVEHVGHEFGVERARRLVEHHKPQPHGQHPHDRDPLLLPAGQPVRVVCPLFPRPNRSGNSVGCATA